MCWIVQCHLWPNGALRKFCVCPLFALSVLMTPHAESAERDCTGYEPGSTRAILASLSGGNVAHEGKKASTVSVFAAAANACSGDVIELVAGDFALGGPAIVVRRHPSDPFEGPITLRGRGEATRILGGTQPGFKRGARSMRPDANEHACVRLDGQAHVVIERLQFEDCWPIAVHAVNSRYVTLRKSRIVGSTFGLYAQGRCENAGGRCSSLDNGGRAHHYLVESVEWIQDPPQRPLPAWGEPIAPGKMWRRYWWMDVHDRGRPYHYFNGALFGSWNILGGVVFRRNRVHNAFNGIRMNITAAVEPKTRNLNIEIYENAFHHIRDNAVEPEREAWNLWVHDNRSVNDYNPLSTDAVSGNFWYVFANTHVFTEAPGAECALDPECRRCLEDPACRTEHLHRRGKTLKLGEGPYPGEAFYVFHNSIFQHHPLAAGGETRNLHLWNNLMEVCGRGDGAQSGCRPTPAVDRLCYDESYRFAGNVTNDAGCLVPCKNSEAAPVCVYERTYSPDLTPFFRAPATGDLRLGPTSPARDAAVPIAVRLPDGTVWRSPSGRAAPDSGAYQGERLFEGPAFLHLDPASGQAGVFREPPRIVRVRQQGATLRLTFSMAIEHRGPPETLAATVKPIRGNETLAVGRCRIEGRVLECMFPDRAPDKDAMIMLPDGIVSAARGGRAETAGVPMTFWASVDARFCRRPDLCPRSP